MNSSYYDVINLILSDYVLLSIIVALLLILGAIVWAIVKSFNVNYLEMKFSDGLNLIKNKYSDQKISESIKSLTKTLSIRLSFFDRLEIRYVDKTLLRNILFFANIYVLLLFCFGLFLVGFIFSYTKIYHIGISGGIGLILAAIPLILLDTRAKYLSELVRKMMATWISTLNKAADIKEDLVFILEHSLSTAQEPLKTYISECVIQLRNGLNESEVFDLLSMKIDSQQFKNFIINLKQNKKYGGNIKKLLSNCEDEFYALEEEYERRKITTFGARIRIYVMMIVVIVVAYYLLQINPDIRAYYLTDPIGKWLSTLYIIVYFIAFIISTKISNFDY